MHLLDINVLIALIDPAHAHHRPARKWFLANRVKGWVTCPITENGLVRIVSNPNYPGGIATTENARSVLDALCRQPGHSFWPDSVTVCDQRLFKSLTTSKQLTDSYLLALAVKNGGRLVTFDRKLNLSSVAGGAGAVLQVSPK